MYKLKDLYLEAMESNEKILILFIEFLVKEKKVLTFEDDTSKLDYYFQERFRDKMNAYLKEYMEKRG